MSSVQFLERPGEPRLAWFLDVPAAKAAGKVLLIHGYADHSDRFEHVARFWAERGLVVARFDLRGHGRSGGTRGHVMSVDEYVNDARAVLAALEKEPAWKDAPGRPVIFGHSLGGLIASELALAVGKDIAGVASTSPFFGPKRQMTAFERVGGKFARKVAPTLRQSSGLSGSDMTHDTAIAENYDRDPYRFGHVTVGWFFAMLDAQRDVLARAGAIEGPLFCIAAGDDRVVSLAETERFFELAGSAEKELDVSAGSFHELLNEPEWRHHAGRLADRMLRWSAA